MRTKHCRRIQLLGTIERKLSLRLYANNLTVNDDVKASDFVEVTGGGYSAKSLDAGQWKVHGRAGAEIATHPDYVWRFTGRAGFVYGIYLLDEKENAVLEVYPLDPPEFIRQDGDEIKVTDIILR